jgi:DNA-binding NarL/FixJ family response regulator
MRKILIVDDHEVLRDSVKRVFDQQAETTTFGEAGTVPEALKLIREQDWDVVVLDISLGDRSGLEVLKELRQLRPGLPVLVLSMHSEEQYARRAFMAGAAGYITKDSPRAELVEAIKRVAEGGRYMSPALAENLVIDLEGDSDGRLH